MSRCIRHVGKDRKVRNLRRQRSKTVKRKYQERLRVRVLADCYNRIIGRRKGQLKTRFKSTGSVTMEVSGRGRTRQGFFRNQRQEFLYAKSIREVEIV